MGDTGAVRAEVPAPSGLRPVVGTGLRHEIVGILRDAIWSGAVRPGERLNELRLSEQLAVSRPPLREAIRVLEHEGLVVSIPRRGSFVRALSGEDISEIYACRCALEGMAAELAMDVDPALLDELEDHLAWIEDGLSTGLVEVVSRDLEFHRALVRLSGNSRLVSMWEEIAGQIRLALTLVDPEFFHSDFVGSTHRALVEAIRRADRTEAQRLTRALLDVGRTLRDRWDERVGGAERPLGRPSGQTR